MRYARVELSEAFSLDSLDSPCLCCFTADPIGISWHLPLTDRGAEPLRQDGGDDRPADALPLVETFGGSDRGEHAVPGPNT